MNNFLNWLIDLLSHSKITALEKENAGIMDTNIMLLERVEDLARENKKLIKENQRLKNELMGPQIYRDLTEGMRDDFAKLKPEQIRSVNNFVAEVEKNLKARGINPKDSFVWREMKARSEAPQEIKTDAAMRQLNIKQQGQE